MNQAPRPSTHGKGFSGSSFRPLGCGTVTCGTWAPCGRQGRGSLLRVAVEVRHHPQECGLGALHLHAFALWGAGPRSVHI